MTEQPQQTRPPRWNAQRFKDTRKAHGFTRPALASRIHVAVTTLRGWENGTSQPRGASLIALAETLDVPPEQFYD